MIFGKSNIVVEMCASYSWKTWAHSSHRLISRDLTCSTMTALTRLFISFLVALDQRVAAHDVCQKFGLFFSLIESK